MTVVALPVVPPRDGLALTDLADSAPISASEAADLYAAMVQDAMVAVARSGGDLLVNYRADDELPVDGEADAETQLRQLAEPVLDDLDDVRFEVQVGSTEAARFGNTIAHLLGEEGANSAAILRPEAPLVDRSVVDAAAMKLRRDEVVLGPAPGGRVYYAGFTEPIDFEDALAPPAVETLANRGADGDHGVEFESMQPLLQRGGDLATLLPMLRARRIAGREVPPATAGVLEDLGIALRDGEVVRE